MRAFQSIGLIDAVLPHTVPNQILRFTDSNRKLLVEMALPDARFGWPKRNGFVQPLVDAELCRGLDRFDQVGVRWGTRMSAATQDADGVTVTLDDGSVLVRGLPGRLRRRPQHHPAPDGRQLRRHHLGHPLAGHRHRQRPARTPQQRSRGRPGPAVRVHLHRVLESGASSS